VGEGRKLAWNMEDPILRRRVKEKH